MGDPGAIPSGSTITFAGGTLQYSNTVDYSSAPYGILNSSGPIAIDTNGNNMTYAGVLNSSNSGGLAKIGLGTLILRQQQYLQRHDDRRGRIVANGDPGRAFPTIRP